MDILEKSVRGMATGVGIGDKIYRGNNFKGVENK